MRITVISCVFPPEPAVSSRTSDDIARSLADRGHDVVVVAPFPNRPSGRVYPGHRRSLWRWSQRDSISVLHTFSFLSRTSGIASRMAENISFALSSSVAFLLLPRPDVVYVNTWPIFGAGLLAVAARLRGVAVVLSIQDVYPEALGWQSSGLLRRLFSRILLTFDRQISRAASAVIVISRSFAELYQTTRHIEQSRLSVVPNWLPSEGTAEVEGTAAGIRARHGIPAEAKLIVYGGNVGSAAGLETVIQAVRSAECIHLLIAGEGTSLTNCRRLAEEIAPRRIHFEAPWKSTMPVLHAADVLILPTRGSQSASSVPSKLISYLLAGRPVIAMALESSDTANSVRESGAGVVIPPDDAKRVAEAAIELFSLTPQVRKAMGVKGREWALRNLTREHCLPEVIRIIEEAAR